MNAQSKIEPGTLCSAMALAFAEIEAATKGTAGQVGQQKYKYADLGAVIEAIKPALIAHGLFFTQHPQPSEDGVCVETVLHHSGGEHFSLGSLFVPANKRDAQGFGSALTYARRYGLMTAFGVPAEDDDGNAASRPTPRADPVPTVGTEMATDSQCALILTLAPVAGKTIQGICEAYKISALPELTEPKAAKLIERLQADAKAMNNA